jgi:hypothetical protein
MDEGKDESPNSEDLCICWILLCKLGTDLQSSQLACGFGLSHLLQRVFRIHPRAQTSDESLGLSLINSKESGNGGDITKFTPSADRFKGLSGNIVSAAPRYSSLLKLTRRKRAHYGMETRERVFMSISDWVFRRVKDPLVEIDPNTVTKIVKDERKIEGDRQPTEEDYEITGMTVDPSTAVATTSPSLFGYLPPGFPKGADSAALAAATVLLLAALGSATVLALKGDKKGGRLALATESGGQGTNGSVTNGGARKEVEGDKSADIVQEPQEEDEHQKQTQPKPVMSYPLETPTFAPIPQYSTSLEQSDLPLPPSIGPGGSGTKENKMDDHSSSEESKSKPGETAKKDSEATSGNGVVKSSALGVAALAAAEMASAAREANAASPSLEEPSTGKSGSQKEKSVDLGPEEDAEPAAAGAPPSYSISSPTTAGASPSKSESEPAVAVAGAPPSYSISAPATAGAPASKSESEPAVAGAPPSYSISAPAGAGAPPSKSEVEPAVAAAASSYSLSAPTTAEAHPSKLESEHAVAGALPSKSESGPAIAGVLPATTESTPEISGLLPSKAESEPAIAGVLPATTESTPEISELLPSKAESEPATARILPATPEFEQLSQTNGSEYMLHGKSEKPALSSPPQPVAAIPEKADVGIPVGSFLVDKSQGQRSSEEVSADDAVGVQFAAAKIGVQAATAEEGVPLDSIPFGNVLEDGPEVGSMCFVLLRFLLNVGNDLGLGSIVWQCHKILQTFFQ